MTTKSRNNMFAIMATIISISCVDAVEQKVWQPELPKTGDVILTRPVTCRIVSYGGKWTRHGFGGHSGGPCMFRYSTTPAYDPFPDVKVNRREKMLTPMAYDVDGDGDTNDDFVAALTFSLTKPLGILDWPKSATFPERYSARFYGGNAWYVSDAKPQNTHYIQEIGINADHNIPWLDTRAEDHPLNGAANEKIASSGLRYYFVPIWVKKDFLNGGDRYKVTFDTNSFFGSLCTRGYWEGFDDVRYVVQDGDQLYISDNKQYNIRKGTWNKEEPGSIFGFRPAEATWTEYNPKGHIMHFDPKAATFKKRKFKDIQAVGWYLAKNGLAGKLAHGKWYGAEFKATVNLPKSLKSVNVDMKTIPAGNGVPEFSMSTCEIPYLLWKHIWKWGDSPHYTLDQRYLYRKTGDMGSMRYGSKSHSQNEPVTDLNWYDTLAWCNTLSEMEGKTPCYYTDPGFKTVFRNMHQGNWYQGRINPKETKKPEPIIYVKWDTDGHRLPTPSEWLAATGESMSDPSDPSDPSDKSNKSDSTYPVGTTKQNKNGIYDMSGNVWELVWPYGNTYNPATNLEIVALGGSFHGNKNPEFFSASPYGDVPFNGHHAIGFRIISRDSGLAKPQDGELKGIPTWTIRKNEKLTAAKKADPIGPGQLETVAIPAGSYKKKGNQEIKVSAMHIGKTEVSFAQWEKVRKWAEANGYEFDTFGDMGSMFFFANDHSPAEPVVRVRWNDMVIWCNALSEMEGRTPVYYTDEAQTKVYRKAMGLRPPKTDAWDLIRPGGSKKLKGADTLRYTQNFIFTRWDADGYRLPTYAERNYVQGKVWWDSENRPIIDEKGWHMLNSAGRTHPVGQKKPNAFGLYDLYGNVYEWLWDHKILRGETLRPKLNNNNPKNSMFWIWEEGDSENYQNPKIQAKIKHWKKHTPPGWASAQATGGSWLWDSPEGFPWKVQMHYADLGFRVVRCDAGTHPRDGLYAWDKLPVMLDTTNLTFEMNSGKVWRGDNGRSGVYPSPGIRKLKGVKWTYNTGGKVTSSPLVVDGKMYIGTVKGVLCLNAEDGSVIWEKPIKGGSDSSACLYDGVIYIGGNNSKLHALKADSGETVWTSPATGPLKSSPCVVYDVVFCGHATGVSIKDGKPVWGQDQKLGKINQPGDGRLSSPAIGKDTYALAAFSGRHVNIRTGMGADSTPWEGQNTFPILDGVIYGVNSGMGGNVKTPDLVAHKNGKTLWSGKFQKSNTRERYIAISAPAIWTDYVFVASDYGSLVGFNRSKGKKLWEQTFKKGLAIRSACSVSQDGLIYLGTHDHNIYCIDGKTGDILWKYKTGGPIVSSACIADGMVFIGSNDGKIYAFEGARKPKKRLIEPKTRTTRK